MWQKAMAHGRLAQFFKQVILDKTLRIEGNFLPIGNVGQKQRGGHVKAGAFIPEAPDYRPPGVPDFRPQEVPGFHHPELLPGLLPLHEVPPPSRSSHE